MAQEIVVAGLSGGPCSGKTTALAMISEKIPTMTGWDVYLVPEAATLLVNQGVQLPQAVQAGDKEQIWNYERSIARLSQRLLEEVISCAKSTGNNSLIVCDRPIRDVRAYLPEGDLGDDEYINLLREAGLDAEEVFVQYKGVFKLTTAANGAEQFYTLSNNTARRETPDEARYLDERIEVAYLGHPHLRVIDNSTNFKGKMTRLLKEICALIGVPQPLEIERKYLIAKPDFGVFTVPYRDVMIEQAYLVPYRDEGEIRIRRRSFDGVRWTYYLTEKKWISRGQRIEKERIIRWREYHDLFGRLRKRTSAVIEKRRYHFLYKGQYFELDHITQPVELYLLEVELTDIAQTVDMPPFVRVVKEVTGEQEYSNSEIARRVVGSFVG